MKKLYKYWITSVNKKKSAEQKEQDVLLGDSNKNRAIADLPSNRLLCTPKGMINLSYHFFLGNSRVERKNDMSKQVVASTEHFGGVFPDKETFNRIYEECLENEPQASQAVRNNYSCMHDTFEEYLNAVQEDMFRYAYQCGYEAAIAAFEKGGAA